jgi:hypothetical protein
VASICLTCCDEWLSRFQGSRTLTFFGTPAYGVGDWHYHRERHGEAVASRLNPGASLALFALGDRVRRFVQANSSDTHGARLDCRKLKQLDDVVLVLNITEQA